MTRRQPLAAKCWGSLYRTWWPLSTRHRKRAKRRSARRERQQIRNELRSDHGEPRDLGSS